MDHEDHQDGRIARRFRTRAAIVTAHTELVSEGVLRPTAQRVADRAGVSVRTIWTNFADLESLLRSTTERWMKLDAEIADPVDPDLRLAERIEQFCARQAERVEHLAPAARSSILGEPFSAALRDGRRTVSARLWKDLEHTFCPELGPRMEHGSIYDELYVIVAWPVWKMLTEDLGRTRAQALRATTEGCRRALAQYL